MIGEIAQEIGIKDRRGKHSAVIREMVAAAAAKWMYSPYVCRSARHTVYVTKRGDLFFRQVQILRLSTTRQKLPCYFEMKPEKREYYHRKHRDSNASSPDEHKWFLSRWLFNYFAVWNGKKNADELDSFQQEPLSSHTDTFGTTYKSADLAVHALGGRFLTREITVGLRDYVQWKEPLTPIFDRIDIPIDVPTFDLEICAIVDQELFSASDVKEEEIANLALEFRNRESARFEGKEVALYPGSAIEEQYGRCSSADLAADDGADEVLRKLRRLRSRVTSILEISGNKVAPFAEKVDILSSLKAPEHFLFYWLRWPSPHLGLEACVRWEKPVRKDIESTP
jgi:hypothetical protein